MRCRWFFSHQHLKGCSGEAHDENLSTLLIDRPRERITVDERYLEPETNCRHIFRAASKPKILTKFDETGLMGLTCRYGQGIPYINLYEGERYTYAYRLLRRIKTSNPMFSNFILRYDIGCRFDPYLKRTDPGLWKETTGNVNTIHVYGHPLSCQVTRGPKRTLGVGESNSEDPKRDWSSKRHFVAAGKVSSASRRQQVLDTHSRQCNITLRDTLPCFLSKRLGKARKCIAEANKQLQLVFATCLKITDQQGSEVLIDWSMDFVDSQIRLQQRFFQDSPTKRKVNA